jgi:hypothetical protein
MEPDWEAARIRSLILLRATCEKVLERLDEDDIEDLALTVQITELCDTLANEFDRFQYLAPTDRRHPKTPSFPPEGA